MSFILIKRSMSKTMGKLITNAEIAERKLVDLRNKLEEVKKIKIEIKIKELTEENSFLVNKIDYAKAELIKLETLHGKKQYPIPGKPLCTLSNTTPQEPINTEIKQQKSIEKKEKDAPKKTKAKTNEATSDLVDVGKLDFRIGKIVEINKHPDADSLYVEKIDCGEENPRTIVSGLVNHVPINEMQEKIVMVLCNLKPSKMRGISSEGMVMCASSPNKVEVLNPPLGAVPGDLVSCEGYPREPEPQLNPKKKIFETCAPDLLTNDDRIACYKGSPLIVSGKGPITAPTLKNVNVK